MPSTLVGCGSVAAASVASTTAACAVGHDTPAESAASATERRASPTADAIAHRNRPVVRPCWQLIDPRLTAMPATLMPDQRDRLPGQDRSRHGAQEQSEALVLCRDLLNVLCSPNPDSMKRADNSSRQVLDAQQRRVW
jgi:hypothetical protein